LSAIAYLPNWTGFASCYAGPKFLEANILIHFADTLRHRFGGRPEKILSGITICAG
jgi:hypothetical protein